MSAAQVKLGVLDWGIGGLGVVAALRSARVRTPVIYLSDTGAIPYGKLPRRALAQRVDTAIGALRQRGATHVLIACNAASTVIAELTTPLPVYGVIEPALAELTSREPLHIGVIGGVRTIRSGIHRRALLAARHDVTQRIAQPLSAHIESGTMSSKSAALALTRITKPLLRVQVLVLACTHYPAIAPRIETLLPSVELFDPAQAAARSIARALPRSFHSSTDDSLELLCTGDARAMRTAATRAWGRDPGRCRAIELLE